MDSDDWANAKERGLSFIVELGTCVENVRQQNLEASDEILKLRQQLRGLESRFVSQEFDLNNIRALIAKEKQRLSRNNRAESAEDVQRPQKREQLSQESGDTWDFRQEDVDDDDVLQYGENAIKGSSGGNLRDGHDHLQHAKAQIAGVVAPRRRASRKTMHYSSDGSARLGHGANPDKDLRKKQTGRMSETSAAHKALPSSRVDRGKTATLEKTLATDLPVLAPPSAEETESEESEGFSRPIRKPASRQIGPHRTSGASTTIPQPEELLEEGRVPEAMPKRKPGRPRKPFGGPATSRARRRPQQNVMLGPSPTLVRKGQETTQQGRTLDGHRTLLGSPQPRHDVPEDSSLAGGHSTEDSPTPATTDLGRPRNASRIPAQETTSTTAVNSSAAGTQKGVSSEDASLALAVRLSTAISSLPELNLPEIPDNPASFSIKLLGRRIGGKRTTFAKVSPAMFAKQIFPCSELIKVSLEGHDWAPRTGRHGALTLVHGLEGCERPSEQGKRYPLFWKQGRDNWMYGGKYIIGQQIIIPPGVWDTWTEATRIGHAKKMYNSAAGQALLSEKGLDLNEWEADKDPMEQILEYFERREEPCLRMNYTVLQCVGYNREHYDLLARAAEEEGSDPMILSMPTPTPTLRGADTHARNTGTRTPTMVESAAGLPIAGKHHPQQKAPNLIQAALNAFTDSNGNGTRKRVHPGDDEKKCYSDEEEDMISPQSNKKTKIHHHFPPSSPLTTKQPATSDLSVYHHQEQTPERKHQRTPPTSSMPMPMPMPMSTMPTSTTKGKYSIRGTSTMRPKVDYRWPEYESLFLSD